MKKNSGMAFAMLGVEDDESIDKFVNENIELVKVRPTDKNEDLKNVIVLRKSFKLSEELLQTLKDKSKGNLINSVMNEMMTKQLNYKYTLQKIKIDDQLSLTQFFLLNHLLNHLLQVSNI